MLLRCTQLRGTEPDNKAMRTRDRPSSAEPRQRSVELLRVHAIINPSREARRPSAPCLIAIRCGRAIIHPSGPGQLWKRLQSLSLMCLAAGRAKGQWVRCTGTLLETEGTERMHAIVKRITFAFTWMQLLVHATCSHSPNAMQKLSNSSRAIWPSPFSSCEIRESVRAAKGKKQQK